MMRLQAKNQSRQAGFTIVELMIATLVFSVVLIILTAGIIAITKTYYKGVTLNRTQNVARSIMDSISQAVQFSGDTPNWPTTLSNGLGRGCIGSSEYDFQLGALLSANPASTTDTQASHVLSVDTGQSDCVAYPSTDPSDPVPTFTGSEQLSPHMRLIRLNVSPAPTSGPANPDNLWKVDVTVAYGDNDLLCDSTSSATTAGSCQSTTIFGATDLEHFPAGDTLTCRSGNDSAFCAVSSLSTIVQQRLVPGQ